MCYGLFNFGECCPISVDIVTCEQRSLRMQRLRLRTTGQTLIWNNLFGFGGMDVHGGNYAPSITGGGLVMLDNGASGDGLYAFNIETGVIGSRLVAETVPAGSEAGHVYQECKGNSCYRTGIGANITLKAVTAGGAITDHSIPFNTNTGPAIKTAGGAIRRLTGGDLKIYDHTTTVWLDLTSVAVTSTSLLYIVSDDGGKNIYVLGVSGTTFELFHVTNGGTATLLASGAETSTGPASAFTKLGNYIFFFGNGDRIWRYSVATDRLVLALVRTSGPPWSPDAGSGPGECFFAAYEE